MNMPANGWYFNLLIQLVGITICALSKDGKHKFPAYKDLQKTCVGDIYACMKFMFVSNCLYWIWAKISFDHMIETYGVTSVVSSGPLFHMVYSIVRGLSQYWFVQNCCYYAYFCANDDKIFYVFCRNNMVVISGLCAFWAAQLPTHIAAGRDHMLAGGYFNYALFSVMLYLCAKPVLSRDKDIPDSVCATQDKKEA